MAVDVVVIRSDDWEGLYLDGRLVTEEHSLRLCEVLKILTDKTLGSYNSYWIDYEVWAKVEPYWSNLPPNLDDLRPYLGAD